MKRMMIAQKPALILLLIGLTTLWSCKEVALYEQWKQQPGATWSSSRIDSFHFLIKDSTVPYRISVVVRHTNAYPFRNVWVKAGIRQPGTDTLRQQPFDLPLATADSWLGTGMGDVYEVRVPLFPQPVRFARSGEVLFTLQHTMRTKSLPGVLQTGLRIEPAASP